MFSGNFALPSSVPKGLQPDMYMGRIVGLSEPRDSAEHGKTFEGGKVANSRRGSRKIIRNGGVKRSNAGRRPSTAARSMLGAFIAVASLLLLPKGEALGALAGMLVAMLLVASEVWGARFRIGAIHIVCIVIIVGVAALAVAVIIAN
jgi:hypothetical protein